MKKVAGIISIVLIAIIGVFSIGMKKDKNNGANSEGTATVAVTDANGEKVELSKNPEKIVVFDYGVADILKNLGVDIVGLPERNFYQKYYRFMMMINMQMLVI